MNYILDAAESYLAAGICPIPIVAGTKVPDIEALDVVYGRQVFEPNRWRFDIPRLPDERELRYWFGAGTRELGVATGAISGGLVALDFDQPTLLHAWRMDLERFSIQLGKPFSLPTVKTARGHHVYFRSDKRYTTSTLAAFPGRPDIVFSDLRDDGGYLLAPPSIHPTGGQYTDVVGNLAMVPRIPDAMADALIEVAKFPDLYSFGIDGNTKDDLAGIGLDESGVEITVVVSGHPSTVVLRFDQALEVRRWLNWHSTVLNHLISAVAADDHARYVEAVDGVDIRDREAA